MLCLILKNISVIQSSRKNTHSKPIPWNQAAGQKGKLSHQSRDGQTASGPDIIFSVRRKASGHVLPRVTGHLHSIKGLRLWASGKDFHIGALRKRQATSKLELLHQTSHTAQLLVPDIQENSTQINFSWDPQVGYGQLNKAHTPHLHQRWEIRAGATLLSHTPKASDGLVHPLQHYGVTASYPKTENY